MFSNELKFISSLLPNLLLLCVIFLHNHHHPPNKNRNMGNVHCLSSHPTAISPVHSSCEMPFGSSFLSNAAYLCGPSLCNFHIDYCNWLLIGPYKQHLLLFSSSTWLLSYIHKMPSHSEPTLKSKPEGLANVLRNSASAP